MGNFCLKKYIFSLETFIGKGENGGKRKNDAMLSISPYYYEMHTLYIYHKYVSGYMYWRSGGCFLWSWQMFSDMQKAFLLCSHYYTVNNL